MLTIIFNRPTGDAPPPPPPEPFVTNYTTTGTGGGGPTHRRRSSPYEFSRSEFADHPKNKPLEQPKRRPVVIPTFKIKFGPRNKIDKPKPKRVKQSIAELRMIDEDLALIEELRRD